MYAWVAIILWLNAIAVPLRISNRYTSGINGRGTLLGLCIALPPPIWFTINFWHVWF